MTSRITDDGMVRAIVAVVEVVLDQEDEVASASFLGRNIGVLVGDREGLIDVIMATNANRAGIAIAQQVVVAIGHVAIHQGTVFAVVNGMATVAMGNTAIMESEGGHGGKAQADGKKESLSHSETSG